MSNNERDISQIKPEGIQPKPKADIEWNDRTYQSYIKKGFPHRIRHSISGPRDRLLQFLNEVDVRQGPIERTVITMVRVKAIDWSSPKRERKEYLYYTEDWDGKNWLGIPKKYTENVEGKYKEVMTTPQLDERTGEHVNNLFWRGKRRILYSIFKKDC